MRPSSAICPLIEVSRMIRLSREPNLTLIKNSFLPKILSNDPLVKICFQIYSAGLRSVQRGDMWNNSPSRPDAFLGSMPPTTKENQINCKFMWAKRKQYWWIMKINYILEEVSDSVWVCVRLLQLPDDAPRMKAYRIGKFRALNLLNWKIHHLAMTSLWCWSGRLETPELSLKRILKLIVL